MARTRSSTAKSNQARTFTASSISSSTAKSNQARTFTASSISSSTSRSKSNPSDRKEEKNVQRIAHLEGYLSRLLAWLKKTLPEVWETKEFVQILSGLDLNFLDSGAQAESEGEPSQEDQAVSEFPGPESSEDQDEDEAEFVGPAAGDGDVDLPEEDPLYQPPLSPTSTTSDAFLNPDIDIKVEQDFTEEDQQDVEEVGAKEDETPTTTIESTFGTFKRKTHRSKTKVRRTKKMNSDPRCHICGKFFCDAGTVRAHITQVHDRIRAHACHICPKRCFKKSHLNVHLKAHATRELKLKEALTKIPKPKKPPKKGDPHHCPHCEKVFAWKGGLTNHLRDHHSPNPPSFVCATCGKTFLRMQALKEHERLHTGVKPFQCRYCPAAFRHRCAYREHTNRHLGKQYQCPICGNLLGCSKTLLGHIREVHEGVRPYPCVICPLRFKKPSHLKQHLAAHEKGTAVRPLGKEGRKIRPGGCRRLAQVRVLTEEPQPEPAPTTTKSEAEARIPENLQS